MTLVDDDRGREDLRVARARPPRCRGFGGQHRGLPGVPRRPGHFIGKVRDDILGRVFAHDIRASWRALLGRAEPGLDVPARVPGACLIMVTPDAEKTMCTNLGIGALLGARRRRRRPHRCAPGSLYLEGYLSGRRRTDAAVERAVRRPARPGTRVALSLSDPAWVELAPRGARGLLDGWTSSSPTSRRRAAWPGWTTPSGAGGAPGRAVPRRWR